MVKKCTKYKVPSTKYGLEFFSRLDTSYLILKKMSNAERRVQNEEGGTMYEVPSTKYFRYKMQETRD
jgi:hypothetical protein